MDLLTHVVDVIAREALLFAAVGMLIGGADDVLVDLLFVARRLRRRRASARIRTLRDLPAPRAAGGLAILIPAWDEEAVIGAMLRTTLARLPDANLRVFVGLYPNDPATIAAVEAVAAEDPRVRPVIGPKSGPTTKADCLNVLWRALVAAGEDARACEKTITAVTLPVGSGGTGRDGMGHFWPERHGWLGFRGDAGLLSSG